MCFTILFEEVHLLNKTGSYHGVLMPGIFLEVLVGRSPFDRSVCRFWVLGRPGISPSVTTCVENDEEFQPCGAACLGVRAGWFPRLVSQEVANVFVDLLVLGKFMLSLCRWFYVEALGLFFNTKWSPYLAVGFDVFCLVEALDQVSLLDPLLPFWFLGLEDTNDELVDLPHEAAVLFVPVSDPLESFGVA